MTAKEQFSTIMDPVQMNKIEKKLKGVTFYSLATSVKDLPHATVVQPALTEDWDFLIMSNKKSKKVKNILSNPNVWLIADCTSFLKIPRVIYIQGTATITDLNEAWFNKILGYHGFVSRQIFRSLVKDGLGDSAVIQVQPYKYMTIGIFKKPKPDPSFSIQN